MATPHGFQKVVQVGALGILLGAMGGGAARMRLRTQPLAGGMIELRQSRGRDFNFVTLHGGFVMARAAPTYLSILPFAR